MNIICTAYKAVEWNLSARASSRKMYIRCYMRHIPRFKRYLNSRGVFQVTRRPASSGSRTARWWTPTARWGRGAPSTAWRSRPPEKILIFPSRVKQQIMTSRLQSSQYIIEMLLVSISRGNTTELNLFYPRLLLNMLPCTSVKH